MSKAIVLMTALVPTKGHRDLINFAYMLTGEVHVIVSSRSKEPVRGNDRVNAFSNQVQVDWGEEVNIYFSHHKDDDAPQNPRGPDDEDFWDYWKSTVLSLTAVASDDVIVASESYGAKMAEILGCKFMPYDIDRAMRPITGTEVREYVYDPILWDQILPEFRKTLKRTVTIFGAESCGKTTISADVAFRLDGILVPEWARQYLEAVGPELTDEKMAAIVNGQGSIQSLAELSDESGLVVRDTDLLSTLGYYRITKRDVPPDLNAMVALTKADLYVLMNDGIPFEPDPLRYGGDVRETDMNFWKDLLEEFGCRYVVVKETNMYKQVEEVIEHIEELLQETAGPIADFERELPDDEEDVDIEAKFG